MPTAAFMVLEWIDAHPDASPADRTSAVCSVPPNQWALLGGHWNELARHCGNRATVPEEPRFMNRLSINRMTPLPRCLYRSPDGRGLAWLRSGGEVVAYGMCEQSHCERAGNGSAP